MPSDTDVLRELLKWLRDGEHLYVDDARRSADALAAVLEPERGCSICGRAVVFAGTLAEANADRARLAAEVAELRARHNPEVCVDTMELNERLWRERDEARAEAAAAKASHRERDLLLAAGVLGWAYMRVRSVSPNQGGLSGNVYMRCLDLDEAPGELEKVLDYAYKWRADREAFDAANAARAASRTEK